MARLAFVLALLFASPPLVARAQVPYVLLSGDWTSLDGNLTTTRFGAGPVRTPLGSTSSEEVKTASGPLPNVGVGAMLRPGGPLVLRGELRFFKGGVKDDHGSTFDAEAAAGVRLTPWMELGGGVRRFDISVSLDNHETEIDLNYTGLVAYARLGL